MRLFEKMRRSRFQLLLKECTIEALQGCGLRSCGTEFQLLLKECTIEATRWVSSLQISTEFQLLLKECTIEAALNQCSPPQL